VPSPDYLPLAYDLPAVYQEDEESFAQLDSYLGLVDELNRAVLGRLEGITTWLSPLATETWPPALAPDAGRQAVLDAMLAVLDELAFWTGFAFPTSWTRDAVGIARRRAYLLKAARIWRRRGTPRGFLDWFCLAFAVEEPDRPWLLEHFKFGAPVTAAGETGPDPWLRATLLVRSTEQFTNVSRRREAIAFVNRYLPAHVHARVCWVKPDFDLDDDVPGPDATATAIADYRTSVRRLLCSLVSFIDHANGIRIWECIDEGRAIDRLGIGRLPGGGEIHN
jgi:hypothetical protein